MAFTRESNLINHEAQHRPRKAIVQLACTMIQYLPVSYSVLMSSPNGLAVVVTDTRVLGHWFDTHLLKKRFSYFYA